MFFQSFSMYTRWNFTGTVTSPYVELYIGANALSSTYLGSLQRVQGPQAFNVTAVTMPVDTSN